ncbi:ABC transporter permease [Heliophilum fasciatum]|uniref:NitT/TauT family transport system permease protein n=1 Tax=Heliophilum fasciatum TaxID=35700 RepID=A0A4R2RQM1_9FIRM|nr:ABC transporter permease [Heliophilum fasciatum]MCW2277702.1 NitT/TauT family transport system permease protein [Heliophilum fasciatum]TCP65049.1 NitT/TauT family transport system permease protein [Heliophilum fasciatum]
MEFAVNIGRKAAVILVFLALWELAPTLGWIDPLFVPPLSAVLAAFNDPAVSAGLWKHTQISLVRALGGYLLALALAIPLGFLLGGWFKKLNKAFDSIVNVCAQTNPFIFYHIVMLFLGIDESSKVVMIAWTCTWPILFNTIAGIQHTDPLLIKSARSFGVGRWRLFSQVVLPAAAPAIFTGMRLSAGYAFLMLVAAEMMGADSGLGWLLRSYQENYYITRIFAAALLIALLGLTVDAVIGYFEKRFARRAAMEQVKV